MTKASAMGLATAVLVALLVTLGYFVVADGWTRLATPIPGLVAIGAGLVGFGISQLAGALLGPLGGQSDRTGA